MKIVVDENMPFADKLFSYFGDVEKIKGRPFNADHTKDADVLLVRSVTDVNAALLKNSPVTFVGTATAGTDHVDIPSLEHAGIHFASAAGCNAISVVEYVFSAMLLFAERDGFDLRDKCVGIIGVGNVGSRLAKRLNAWGVKTLLCDPPREKQENNQISANTSNTQNFERFETLIKEADILTFHTPLIYGGEYNTFHLFDHLAMSEFADNRIIINASRGEVIDNLALLRAIEQGRKWRIALDVWEDEPNFSTSLLPLVDIATAHIAGYSLEGKARGTTFLGTALYRYLKIHHLPLPDLTKFMVSDNQDEINLSYFLPAPDITQIAFNGELNQRNLKRLIDLVYDVRTDDALFRLINLGDRAVGFDQLRKAYAVRREWASLQVKGTNSTTRGTLESLGFSVC